MKNEFLIPIWNNYHGQKSNILMLRQIDFVRNNDQNEFGIIHCFLKISGQCLKQHIEKNKKKLNSF